MAGKKEAISLPTMLGMDENLFVISKGVEYTIRALDVTEVAEFVQDNLYLSGYRIMSNEDQQVKVDKWMKRCLKDTGGEPVTMEKVKAVPWNITDIRKFVMRLMDISG